MIVEKELELTRPIDSLLDCRINNEIHYEQQPDGVRAIGTLQVTGQASYNKELFDILEEISLDVLAPFEKIKEGETFRILLHHYETRIENRKPILTIYLNAYGIKEERKVDIPLDKPERIKPVAVFPDVVTPFVQEKTDQPLQISQEEIQTLGDKQVQEETFPQEEVSSVSYQEEIGEIEDLFDDAENVMTKTRYILAQLQDTYETIAKRYQVSEKALVAVNRNKKIEERTLVLLPLQ